MRSKLSVILPILFVAGCQTASNSSGEPEWKSILDKTLRSGGSEVVVRSDGRILGVLDSGERLEGTWENRNGRYCRKIDKPARIADSRCQRLVFSGSDTVTFISHGGGRTEWSIN